MGALKDALIGTASYLPPVNHVFNQWRSFAQAKLPFCGLKNVCAISSDKNAKVPRVLIASADGFLYIYDLNANDGGECTLIKQHKLDDCVPEPSPPLLPDPSFSPSGETATATACHSLPGPVSYATAVRGMDHQQQRQSSPTPSPSPGSSPA